MDFVGGGDHMLAGTAVAFPNRSPPNHQTVKGTGQQIRLPGVLLKLMASFSTFQIGTCSFYVVIKWKEHELS